MTDADRLTALRQRVLDASPWYDKTNPDYTELDAVLAAVPIPALRAWIATQGDYRDSRDGIPSAYPEGWNDALAAVDEWLNRNAAAGVTLDPRPAQRSTPVASRERNLVVAYRRHLERGCECPKWPDCAPHDAKEWGGSEPDDCSPHQHVRPTPDTLREALTFIADWARDCVDPEHERANDFYGFRDVEAKARAALEADRRPISRRRSCVPGLRAWTA